MNILGQDIRAVTALFRLTPTQMVITCISAKNPFEVSLLMFSATSSKIEHYLLLNSTCICCR